MTPWDQSPAGAGPAGDRRRYRRAPRSTSSEGSAHSTIFDNTAEHNRVVIDFFTRHGPRRGRGRRRRGSGGEADA